MFKQVLTISLLIISIIFCCSCKQEQKKTPPPPTRQIHAKTLTTSQDIIDAVNNNDEDELQTALEKAKMSKDPNFYKKLANTTVQHDYSMLHIAIWKNNARLAKVLLYYGANVEAKTEWGFTPLHEVTRCEETNDRQEILEMLVNRNADVNAITNTGNSPLDIAEIQNNQGLAKMLKRAGAKRMKGNLDLPPVPEFMRQNQDNLDSDD